MSAIGLSLLPATSLAQTTAPQSGEFTVQNFQPAPGTKNFLGVEGLRMDGNWGFSVGLFFNYAKNPFVLLSCRSQTDCSDKNATNKSDVAVISDMMTADILAAVSPVKRLQIGLRLPVSYVSGAGIDVKSGGPAVNGLKKFGVGDPTLEGKVRLFGNAADPYLVGAALDVSFPVGHAFSSGATAAAPATNYYLGNSSPVTVGVRGIFDGAAGPLQFGLNLRGVFRETARLASTTVGPVDFRYGVGLGYRVSPIFRVLAEGFGGTQFSAKNGTNTLEVDGAVEIAPLSQSIILRVGGGAGILEGVGVPAGRGFLGIAYAHEIGDKDGDGIPDDVDKCPTIPEDKDGFEDADGCPDPDNDGDKIPDEKDKCPNMPETVNGFQDADGCPDEVADRDKDGIPDDQDKCPDAGGKDIIRTPGSKYFGCPDTDHDGIPDFLDKCPTEPEDTDGFEDADGCPDPDNDGDKIPDEQDECPDKPETYNGFQDADGCPDEAPDRDHDGIPDAKDKCPDKPENYNGFEDADGCPDKGPALVQISDTGIKILDKVEFATGKDVIQGTKSFKVLDAVAGVLNGHKDVWLVEIAGHTDNAGPADDNRRLSQKRAEAVMKYLVGKGVDPKRLAAKGYGPDVPVADNKTTAGKQKNRRVEFTILKSNKNSGVVAAPPGGAPAAPPPKKKK
jgi:outer membrane protein OmpA-like peptidoglycan-associated protein